MNTENQSSKSLLGKLRRFTGSGSRGDEKARLEAFLSAVPGEYCGWSKNDLTAFSQGFCDILGLEHIESIHDIQNALSPSDAAVLEGMFLRLQENGQHFSITVRTHDKSRTLKLSGKRGEDPQKSTQFDVLWLEDISALRAIQQEVETAQENAETERERLQKALDHLQIPLWIRDHQTEIVWCNRAYAQAIDTTPATVISEQRELNIKPVNKQSARKRVGQIIAQQAINTQKSVELRAHAVLDGKRKLLQIQETPLPGNSETLGMAQDVTRIEELKSEQNRYATANQELLEQLGTAIGIFDASEKLEFYNSAFAQLWDLEDSYLNSHPKLGDVMEKLREVRRLPEQADFRKFKQSWVSMFTRLLTPHDEMLYLPDGKALRMLVIPHPMGGLMMTFEDVTGRLELESSYNTLIAVQKETLDNLLEGVAAYGGDGRLKLWNPAFARLWRLNPEDLNTEPHISKIAEKMKARFATKEKDKQKEGLIAQAIDRNTREGRLLCEDGTQIRFATLPLPDGGVLVTHVDITDTIQVENALREKNAALETAERLKLDFLANVSYQLRTPLNAIMGFSEILSNEYFGKLNDRQKEYTEGMTEAGDRLLRLIDDILDLSTIEAGYLELTEDEFSIYGTLKAIHDLTQDWARKKKIEVKMSCAKNIGALYADERRLKQSLLNLISNAITYTDEGGTITISAKKKDESIILSVADNGHGIPEEDQKRIFEPFERSGTGGGKARSGAGLGLTLVKNITELHDGAVILTSAEGKGTTVDLIIPAKAPAKATPKKQAKSA